MVEVEIIRTDNICILCHTRCDALTIDVDLETDFKCCRCLKKKPEFWCVKCIGKEYMMYNPGSEIKYLTPISENVLQLASLIEDPEEYDRLRMVFLANRDLQEFLRYLEK